MKSIYINSSVPEKLAKEKFKIPENVMMENAASALEKAIYELADSKLLPAVFIVCGSGNNGGDGFALARRLFGKTEVYIYAIANPKTEEAKIQCDCAKALGVIFLQETDFITKLETVTLAASKNHKNQPIIVDCIFGTGFHGELPDNINSLINHLNAVSAKRLACDISSGLAFNADVTVTMGALKTSLFSDKAKNVSGEIKIADLGIGAGIFERILPPDACLIEKQDLQLPWRTKKAAHKGSYGHFCVFAGEKSGAGIISASAGLNFGSGLVSLIKTENSNLEQFKISPELMICDFNDIPKKTTAISIGSGLGNPSPKIIEAFINWFMFTKNPACVIDADLFSYDGLPELLEKLNDVSEAKIILTPHLKEFSSLCQLCGLGNYKVSELSDDLNLRLELGKKLCEKYKKTVVVIKSSNTLICGNRGLSPQFYVCADGTPSLAKAGSGDVLAGMCGALLAQGYDAITAAITGVEAHALAGVTFDEGKGFDLSALKLIEKI